MTSRALPHDTYITAISEALTEAGLPTADDWTSDADTRGVYCYLNAVITLDPDITGLDEDEWPHGVILVWEWHTGREEQYERGPSWQWAELLDHGRSEEPQPLPVDGYAPPSTVVEVVRGLIASGKPSEAQPGQWDHVAELTAAIEKWGSAEEGSDG